MQIRRLITLTVVMTMFVLCLPAAASAEVVPGDVLTEVRRLGETIDALADRDVVASARIDVASAQPREVWFQAREVWGLADRLALEQTGTLGEPPLLPAQDIRPADVRAVVLAAQARLDRVAAARGVTTPPIGDPAPRTTTPTDVFAALLVAGERLVSLLASPPDAGDAWRSATQCVILGGRLLAATGVERRIPDEGTPDALDGPALKSLLVSLIDRTAAAVRARGHRVSDLTLRPGTAPDAALVVQVITWVESELRFLVLDQGGASGPDAWDPGVVELGELAARLTVLDAQLSQLGDLKVAP